MKLIPTIAIAVILAATAVVGTHAQGNPPPSSGHAGHGAHPMAPSGAMPHHPMGAMMSHGAAQQASAPTESGQAAFAAIQEIVGKLQADPSTDWSKVDIDALRQHLIDMDEVTMRATANKTAVDGGLRISVTGSDRTLAAIRRMVPDHAREIDGMNGWDVRATELPDGVELVVTSRNPGEAQKIRALGFMGIMTQGSHHQVHHFGMAKGAMIHRH